MQTANLSTVVLTERNFTKQNALKTGSWMERLKNLIENTHFKKKKVEKNLKSQSSRELWEFEN